jgi:hypothetical protein
MCLWSRSQVEGELPRTSRILGPPVASRQSIDHSHYGNFSERSDMSGNRQVCVPYTSLYLTLVWSLIHMTRYPKGCDNRLWVALLTVQAALQALLLETSREKSSRPNKEKRKAKITARPKLKGIGGMSSQPLPAQYLSAQGTGFGNPLSDIISMDEVVEAEPPGPGPRQSQRRENFWSPPPSSLGQYYSSFRPSHVESPYLPAVESPRSDVDMENEMGYMSFAAGYSLPELPSQEYHPLPLAHGDMLCLPVSLTTNNF